MRQQIGIGWVEVAIGQMQLTIGREPQEAHLMLTGYQTQGIELYLMLLLGGGPAQ